MELRLATRSRGDYSVVYVDGEVDIATADQLRGHLSGSLEGRVIVDLSRVPFMDCRGANTLLSAQREARQCGGEIRLAAPRPSVCKLLALTGLYQVLPPYPTVWAATQGGDGAITDISDLLVRTPRRLAGAP